MTPDQHRAAARSADRQALTARTRAESRYYRRQATGHRLAALITDRRTPAP